MVIVCFIRGSIGQNIRTLYLWCLDERWIYSGSNGGSNFLDLGLAS